MTPDSQSLHKLVEEIHRCKTQKRAIELAAQLVKLFTTGPYRVDTLERKFGDALAESTAVTDAR